MLSTEQMANKVIGQGQEIARLWEHSKSAQRRLDDTDKIISGIHELAKNVAAMAAEIKLLTDRVDKSVERIEQGQKTQGERIGSIEKSESQIERNEKTLMKHAEKLEAIEKAPADKWNKLTWLIVSGVAMAIIGFVMARLL